MTPHAYFRGKYDHLCTFSGQIWANTLGAYMVLSVHFKGKYDF